MSEGGSKQAPAVRPFWWRLWFALVASLVVFAVAMGLIFRFYYDPDRLNVSSDVLAETIAEQLRAVTRTESLSVSVSRLHERHDADIAMYASTGELLAFAGRPMPPPRAGEVESHWLMIRGGARLESGPHRPGRPAYALHLEDGRWLVARRDWAARLRPPIGPIPMLIMLAVVLSLGLYPVVRRLTRRLERLQASVEALGAGDLSARVDVEGRDEVAQLAEQFNRAAAQVDALVHAQRSLLANASHELRSPLARIRMAIEILGERPSPPLLEEVRANVAELDGLIDEILLASRLESAQSSLDRQRIDLLALAAEEASRAGVSCGGESVELEGDERLLHRVVRNLIENAQRYAHGGGIEVQVSRDGEDVLLEVLDRGPGIAADERARIFEPFYRASGGRERHGGVGLGLALVHQIVTRHSGSVRCEPREGGGSRFVVRLPTVATPPGMSSN